MDEWNDVQVIRKIAEDQAKQTTLQEGDARHCTVRIRTTVWADARGVHAKRSLTFLRRRCVGVNTLEEDLREARAADVVPHILNFMDVKDGIYEIVICNKRYDFETGYLYDYDYRLVRARLENDKA